jgi:hypothetical protein
MLGLDGHVARILETRIAHRMLMAEYNIKINLYEVGAEDWRWI